MTAESPAALIRRASERQREAATNATPGPWAVTSTTAGLTGVISTTDLAPSVYTTHVGAMRSDDMRWMALVDPVVGAALADWLTVTAWWIEDEYPDDPDAPMDWMSSTGAEAERVKAAVTLARSILGETGESDG